MATQHPRAVPTKRLSVAITATATSLTLNNISDWDGNSWTTSTFDSSTSYPVVLRNEANTQYELIEVDTLTLSGTTMDATKRALGYDGTTITGTETAYDWNANETLVEFGSNPPQLYEQYADKIADETIGGVWTFSQTPITNTTPVSSSNIANKAYVDSVVGGIAITNQVTINGPLGVQVSQGNVLYYSSSDQLWYKADADLTTSFQNKTLGIALTSGANTSSVNILTQGYSTAISTSMTAGTKYYISNNAGDMGTTGTYEVYLGYALSSTKFLFEPRRDDMPFAYEKDALAGLAFTATVPSATNQYLTKADSTTYGFTPLSNTIDYAVNTVQSTGQTYYTYQATPPFSSSDDGWTLSNYSSASISDSLGFKQYLVTAGAGFGYIWNNGNLFPPETGTSTSMYWPNVNNFKLKFIFGALRTPATTANEIWSLYIGSKGMTSSDFFNYTTTSTRIGFIYDSSSNGIRMITDSTATAAITVTTSNTISNTKIYANNMYEIEYNASGSVIFSINGSIEATHITNLPTTGMTTIIPYFAFGNYTTATTQGMKLSPISISYNL